MPALLSDRDRPWLRDLIEDAMDHIDRPVGHLQARWHSCEPDPRATSNQKAVRHVLLSMLRRSSHAPSRTAMRRQLFQLVGSGMPHPEAIRHAATTHDLDPTAVHANLFADLPEHRLVQWPSPPPDPMSLILRSNLAMVQGMLRHATGVRIRMRGATRLVLRTAWLRGITLKLSGPHHDAVTAIWHRDQSSTGARALAAIIPLLPWTYRYRLEANCHIGRDQGKLLLTTGDAIQPSPEPRRYDSQLESTFARDFRRAMPDWQLLREPTPITTPHGLAFPDFAMQQTRPANNWLCEIAGLRDPSALPAKLALLQHPNLILCLPTRHAPSTSHPRLIPFTRRVPIEKVTALLSPTQ